MDNEKREWLHSLRLVIIIVTLGIALRTIFYSPIIVDGPSMLPTLEDHDQMIINKFIYRIKQPERFDIIVFHASEEEDFIKRVIGLPGEHIAIENGELFIDGEVIDEPYIDQTRKYEQASFRLESLPGSYKEIPQGHILVLGDNRHNSKDSRSFGLIKIEDVVGKANFVYWPLQRIQNMK